ncbi:hypothetical protein A3770_03p21870 [Chloropicon primus]|uniref:GRIP domain-containing protein n=1 Tax=Chloropicon primus TaxID=1764295 RepID=A0A5B8MGX0_9CHLO|nr:hypothetical protein A3770_03p21870 [Chloropicon primus]|eukprot:QDZ19669.1 hypothetical protein A3770_03p21870 [Chloropicon primus]
MAPGSSGTASPSVSTPGKEKTGTTTRSREQLLKLLETSAKRLKQFDKKYGESKAKLLSLQEKQRKLEEENKRLKRLAEEGREASSASASRCGELEEKDEAIRLLSTELTSLQHESGVTKGRVEELEEEKKEVERKLEEKFDEVVSAEKEAEEERRKVDGLLCKVQELEKQLEESGAGGRGSEEDEGDRKALEDRCKALENRCSKLSDSEQQATDELEKRLQKMQEEEKRLSYLESQVRSLQEEVDVSADRAQEAESLVSKLQTKLAEGTEEGEKLAKRLEASEAQLASALMEAASSEPAQADQEEGATPPREDEEALARLAEEVDKLKAESSELRAEKEQMAEELKSSKELLKESSATNEKAKSNVEDLKKKFLTTAKKKQLEFKSKIDLLQQKLKEQEEASKVQLEEFMSGKENNAGALEVLQKQNVEFSEKVQQLEDLVEKQKKEIASFELSKESEEKEGQKQESQTKKLKAVILELKRKLEKSEKVRQKEAKEISKTQASLQDEKLKYQQVEETSRHEMERLEKELKTYKARAHMLLQQKEDQLKNTVSTEMADKYKDKISSLETEVGELIGSRKEMEHAYAELQERHGKEMAEIVENHKTEIAAKEDELLDKEQDGKQAAMESQQALEEAKEGLKEKEKENSDLQLKCTALEEEAKTSRSALRDLKELHDALEREYKMYKETSEEMIQEKERELAELSASLKDRKTLATYKETSRLPVAAEAPHHATSSTSPASTSPNHKTSSQQESVGFSLENDLLSDITDTNIIEAAKLQASRDAFLDEYIQRIAELEGEAVEYQKEISMRDQLESVLKEELRKKEREESRSNLKESQTDMEYLKNIVLKLLETGEYEVLLPVVSTLLALSPEEVDRVKKAYEDGVHRPGNDPIDYATKAASDVTSYLSGWVFSSSSANK